MAEHLRRFEHRQVDEPQWQNLVLQGQRLTTFSGVIGSGPPGSWSGGGNQEVRESATEQEAKAAFDERAKQLVAAGYTEIRPPDHADVDVWARLEVWFYNHAPANSEYPLAAATAAEDLSNVHRS